MLFSESMELAHSLFFNENVHKSSPDSTGDLFLYEWLKHLQKILPGLEKKEIKQCQDRLEKQLLALISVPQSAAIQKALGEATALLFNVGETFGLYAFIDSCNERLRVKDDTVNNVKIKMCVINVLFGMYSTLGRMMGNTFADTIQMLLRNTKSNDSELRSSSLLCLGLIQTSLGAMCTSYHRDVYKVAKSFYNDKSMQVRASALKLLGNLIPNAAFIVATDTENLAGICFKYLENSNYDVRLAVAAVLSKLLTAALPTTKSFTLNTLSNAGGVKPPTQGNLPARKWSVDDSVALLASGFMATTSKPNSLTVRAGIVEAYISLFETLGKHWAEKNVKYFINHILTLLENPKITSSHIEAVHYRKGVNFILSHVINRMIGEKAQNEAAKELIRILSFRIQQVGMDNSDQNISMNQHYLICLLNQVSSLVLILGSSASVFFSEHATGAINTVMSALLYPAPPVSLAAAWCLRCIVIAVPSQLSFLIDTMHDRIEKSKNSPETLTGYCNGTAAIIGAVPHATLGVPSSKAKNTFSIAEDLLRTASQNSRMCSARTQCGWMIIGSLMTLGAVTVRHFLPKLLLLWRNAFPRSAKEIETEKNKFDQFNWQVALEGRAGALCAMESFLRSCPELISDDVSRRLLVPLECALSMLANLPTNIKASAGQNMKVNAAFMRLRLFSVLNQLPPENYESSITQLIRALINEFALTDKQSAITTSYLQEVSHKYNDILVGTWGADSDHQEMEEQLVPNGNEVSCRTLEHDPVSIYAFHKFKNPRFLPPGPLPLGIAVVDSSVSLFSKIFCATAVKHRVRIVQHFGECLKQTKSNKHHSVQMNILTVLLSCLKSMAEAKSPIGSTELQELILSLLLSLLGEQSDIIRCAVAECVGRLAQVVADNTFTAKISQSCFDKIQLSRDPTIRMGNVLTLGFVHRYVGGIGAGQHLSTSITICLALAQDMSSSAVQTWALHSLVLITDFGGAMIRSYVDHILSLMIKLLMTIPPSATEVHRYIGKCIASLITILGPELQGTAPQISSIRSSCQLASDFLLGNSNLLVIAEGISCYQQLHLFSPKHAALTSLVNILCKNLTSSCLILRQVSCSCLKQLSQRQADQVSQLAAVYFAENRETVTVDTYSTELELEAVLFTLLDKETDGSMQTNVKDTVLMILNSQAISKLSAWLTLLRNVLFIATGEENVEEETKGNEEDEDDDTSFQPVNKETSTMLHQRCNTRVFAVQCVQKIFSLAPAGLPNQSTSQQKHSSSGQPQNADPLITHIQELVRIGFMAATASYDQLQIEGLKVLEELIERFCQAKDPDFDDQPLLEQYQAQFGAALRPAFCQESYPHVLSKACNLCSIWITSGIATDIVDLRRIHQLLVTSLSKVQRSKSSDNSVFSEICATSERLAVLKAWADMYFVALGMKENEANSSDCSSLLDLVIPELSGLYRMWIEALKEYGLACSNGNIVMSDEVPLNVREPSWGSLLCSATLYFATQVVPDAIKTNKIQVNAEGSVVDIDKALLSEVHLLMGISSVPLSQPDVLQNPQKITFCLQSLSKLLEQQHISMFIAQKQDNKQIVELGEILLKVVLTSTDHKVQQLLVQVVHALLQCALLADQFSGKGDFTEKNFLKIMLEILSCIFARHVPSLSETLTIANIRPVKKFKEQSATLISATTKPLLLLIKLADQKHLIPLLTTCLHMVICAIKDSSYQANSTAALTNLLHCLKSLIAQPITDNHEIGQSESNEQDDQSETHDRSERSRMWTRILASTYLSLLDFVESSEDCDINRCLLTFITVTVSFPEVVTVNPSILDRSVLYLVSFLKESNRNAIKSQHLKVISSLLRCQNKVVAYKYCKPIIKAIFQDLDSIGEENPDDWQCVKDEIDVLLIGLSLVNEMFPDAKSTVKGGCGSPQETMLFHVLQVLCKLMEVFSNKSSVYQHCIAVLKNLGTSYQILFKNIMVNKPQLKENITCAIKRSSANSANSDDSAGTNSSHDAAKLKQPTIQLKIDFSNFAKP